MTQIIIEVQGGAVSNITPADADVRIVDWDDLREMGIHCPTCKRFNYLCINKYSYPENWFFCRACGTSFEFPKED